MVFNPIVSKERIPEKWRIVTLKDVSFYISRGKQPKYIEKSEIFTLNQKAIQWGKVQEQYFKYHDPKVKVSSNHFINRDDVVINSTGTGTVGRVFHFKEDISVPLFADSHVTIIRVDKSLLLPRFLMYQLSDPRYQEYILTHFVTGSTNQVELNKSKVQEFSILLPPVDIQKKIVEILSTLDNKINLNDNTIANLEELSQAIFERWFIDFEFLNENGEPYKSSGGKMIETDFGFIPANWSVQKFSEICSIKDGTHDSPKQVLNGHPLVTSKHLSEHKIDFSTTKNISLLDFEKINKRSKVERYDILMSMIGTVGRLYLVQNENINFAIKNVALFKTSEVEDKYEYLYCLLKTKKLTNYIQERLAGSTQQYISLTELRKIPIPLPSERQLKEFKKITNPLFDKIYSMTKENEKLEGIKESLLPKLLSGDIEGITEFEVAKDVSIH